MIIADQYVPADAVVLGVLGLVCLVVLAVGLCRVAAQCVTDQDERLAAVDDEMTIREREARRRHVQQGLAAAGGGAESVTWLWPAEASGAESISSDTARRPVIGAAPVERG